MAGGGAGAGDGRAELLVRPASRVYGIATSGAILYGWTRPPAEPQRCDASTRNTSRRCASRPTSVLLSATGRSDPYPLAWARGARAGLESYRILPGGVGEEAMDRRQLFLDSEDGAEFAREDLRLRGMEDLFREQQSGVPSFRVAVPLKDDELSDVARGGTERILAADPNLSEPPHRRMQEMLRRGHGRALELFRVG